MVCGTTRNIATHHVFFGSGKRKLSDKYGCVEYLCIDHHTGNYSPHKDRQLDLALKKMHQKQLEKKDMSREEFISLFGRSYIWED